MQELGRVQIPLSKKIRLKQVAENFLDELNSSTDAPMMVRTAVPVFRSLVLSSVDKMTDEQVDKFVREFRKMLTFIDSGEA